MRAEIKALHSTDVLDGLENYSPPNEEVFMIPMTLIAGPKGEEGEEIFSFAVCSPGWLAQEELKGSDVVLLRHILLMKRFDFRKVRAFIERYVNGLEAPTWLELGEKLGRLGHWEFEDYQPSPPAV